MFYLYNNNLIANTKQLKLFINYLMKVKVLQVI